MLQMRPIKAKQRATMSESHLAYCKADEHALKLMCFRIDFHFGRAPRVGVFNLLTISGKVVVCFRMGAVDGLDSLLSTTMRFVVAN
jgi:hypothetical protein